MKIKKDDTVKMLYGKDSGRQGVVVAVDPKKGKVVIEGLNVYKKHIKGDGRTQVSEIVTITKPVAVSKVMLLCPECGKPTRVGYKGEGKKKVRVCKKCGKTIKAKEEEKPTKKTEAKKKGEAKKETKKKSTKKSKTVKKKK